MTGTAVLLLSATLIVVAVMLYWRSARSRIVKKDRTTFVPPAGPAMPSGTAGQGCSSLFDEYMSASPGDQLRLATQLLDLRSNPVRGDWGNVSALHFAKTAPVAQLFIERGVSVDVKKGNGDTPLHYAARQWYWPLVEFLVAKGATVNARNEAGETPLYQAVGDDCGSQYGQTLATPQDLIKTVDILIAHNADLTLRARNGMTAGDAAISTRRAIVERRRGASFLDPAIFGEVLGKLQGETAVHKASVTGEASPSIDALWVSSDGTVERTTVQAIANKELARQQHERSVQLMDKGQYREAILGFRTALAATADAPEPEVYLNIAVCHAYLKEFKEAISVLEEATKSWPNNVRLRENLSAIRADAG